MELCERFGDLRSLDRVKLFFVLGVVWVLAVAGYQQSIERCFHDYVVHKAVLYGGAI